MLVGQLGFEDPMTQMVYEPIIQILQKYICPASFLFQN